MTNLETHIRINCIWCGITNHFIMPILGKDATANHKCKECGKYIIEIHTKESEEI